MLDLACGTGDLSTMARPVGELVPIGADLSSGMLAANHSGRPRVQADAAALPLVDARFDGVICGYALRNFTDLAATLAETARVLRPGGRLAILEVVAAPPSGALLRAGHRLWFEHVVPAVGERSCPDADAYHYLPPSFDGLPPRRGRSAPPAPRRRVLDRRAPPPYTSRRPEPAADGDPGRGLPPSARAAHRRRGSPVSRASSSTQAALDSPTPDAARPAVACAAASARLRADERFDPVSVGAAAGVLFTGGGVTLAGRGVAAVLAQPGGLEDLGRLGERGGGLARQRAQRRPPRPARDRRRGPRRPPASTARPPTVGSSCRRSPSVTTATGTAG